MSDPVHPTPAPPNARRKLIRGAFAVPAVLTVSSGSAMANQSSMRCLANHIENRQYPPVTDVPTAPNNTWVRVQLGVMASSDTSKPKFYYVDYRNFPSPPGYLGSQWQQFDIGSNSEVGSKGSQPQPPDPSYTYAQAGGKWAVVRYDASGTVVGVGKGSVGTSAIGASCWSSFMVRPAGG